MQTLAATVRENGEGERRWFCGGGQITWKATAEETGGAFLMFEDETEAGKVTPMHRHPEADETFYLLEGEILLDIDGKQRRLGAGGTAVLPRGVPHAFLVTLAGRMLCIQTPGNGEPFYRQASESAPTPVDFDRVRAAAALTGAIEILGPPPFGPGG